MVKAPRLRGLRLAKVISQEELASKAGVSPTTVTSIEGGGDARYVTLRKIAVALGVTPEELVKPEERAS